MSKTDTASAPKANRRPKRASVFWSWSPVWIALLLVCIAGYNAYQNRGISISIQFQAGHGIKPGDQIKYLGLTVGTVEEAVLDAELDQIVIDARLNRESKRLAVEGTRFWIVRPRVDMTGIEGLETVIGARYIAALPSDVESEKEQAQRSLKKVEHFIGLESAPIRATLPPGGLEIQLRADQRGGLRDGAPVLFRQIPIGALLSVQLADDSSGVIAAAYILPQYKNLICANTVFWNASGIRVQAGLMDGLTVSLDSLQTLISGGVALATPNSPGKPAVSGTSFQLNSKAVDEWTHWTPSIPLASKPLPEARPNPISAKRVFVTDYYVMKSRSELLGSVVITPEGILGPSTLLEIGANADEPPLVLTSLGMELKGKGKFEWQRRGAGLFRPENKTWDLLFSKAQQRGVVWSGKSTINLDRPVNLWLARGSVAELKSSDAMFISQTHLAGEPGAWVFLPGDWEWIQSWPGSPDSYQGAPAVDADTGQLIGVFILDKDRKSAWITLVEP